MKAARLAAAALLLALAACAPEGEGPERSGAAAAASLPVGSGFDFYVLALSWSPSYCAIEGDSANDRQCGDGRDYAFIVHGLWPQFERGYPIDCGSSDQRVPRALAESLSDIMPSVGLVGHQWRRHGSCSGLSQADYFEVVRSAAGRVAIPREMREARRRVERTPAEIEQDFRAANPGLATDGIAVTCEDGMLEEVRICLTKSLEFRSCPEIDRRGCRRGRLTLPATGAS